MIMGVLTKARRLIGARLSPEEALEKASREAQEKQEIRFQDPETRRKWGFKGKTPEEQRKIDIESTQSDPESKG